MTEHRACSVALLALLLPAACLSVQDYGGEEGPKQDASVEPELDAEPPLGADGGPSGGTRRWDWWNPAPTGRTLHGIGGTSDSDVWVAGEGGTIARFDGARWQVHRAGASAARYFAVGTRTKDDVWVAGELDGKIEVEHFDGKEWVKSYPFAGAAFNAFSHGPGNRLFAVVDWDVLELADDGSWRRSDSSENDVFGPPVDVWVGASGEAWMITTGAKLLRLPAKSSHWELQGPVGGVPSNAVGLSISGAGSKLCAFYTGRSAPNGVGFLSYDGAWAAGPATTEPLTVSTAKHGARGGCLTDGRGVLAYNGGFITASPTAAPALMYPSDFLGERFFGMWSLDGSKVYAVGALGAFMTRSSGANAWQERGPTRRKDLLAIDVGFDGAVIAANAFDPDRRSGGDVLFVKDGTFAPYSGGGLLGPSIPMGVTVIGENDAWILANDGSSAGVAHWTGKWSVTRKLGGEPHAIWAPAKDDVWISAGSSVWHGDGSSFTEVGSGAVYRSIHGASPTDVWFAGDGVAHWDGKALTKIASLSGRFDGVWSSAAGRVWLWGEDAILFDGATSVPVEAALHVSAEWTVTGIAESAAGEVFVLTKSGVGTSLLWFDPSRTRLVDATASDLELTAIRGRGDQLWAVGLGGAALRFAPATIR